MTTTFPTSLKLVLSNLTKDQRTNWRTLYTFMRSNGKESYQHNEFRMPVNDIHFYGRGLINYAIAAGVLPPIFERLHVTDYTAYEASIEKHFGKNSYAGFFKPNSVFASWGQQQLMFNPFHGRAEDMAYVLKEYVNRYAPEAEDTEYSVPESIKNVFRGLTAAQRVNWIALCEYMQRVGLDYNHDLYGPICVPIDGEAALDFLAVLGGRSLASFANLRGLLKAVLKPNNRPSQNLPDYNDSIEAAFGEGSYKHLFDVDSTFGRWDDHPFDVTKTRAKNVGDYLLRCVKRYSVEREPKVSDKGWRVELDGKVIGTLSLSNTKPKTWFDGLTERQRGYWEKLLDYMSRGVSVAASGYRHGKLLRPSFYSSPSAPRGLINYAIEAKLIPRSLYIDNIGDARKILKTMRLYIEENFGNRAYELVFSKFSTFEKEVLEPNRHIASARAVSKLLRDFLGQYVEVKPVKPVEFLYLEDDGKMSAKTEKASDNIKMPAELDYVLSRLSPRQWDNWLALGTFMTAKGAVAYRHSQFSFPTNDRHYEGRGLVNYAIACNILPYKYRPVYNMAEGMEDYMKDIESIFGTGSYAAFFKPNAMFLNYGLFQLSCPHDSTAGEIGQRLIDCIMKYKPEEKVEKKPECEVIHRDGWDGNLPPDMNGRLTVQQRRNWKRLYDHLIEQGDEVYKQHAAKPTPNCPVGNMTSYAVKLGLILPRPKLTVASHGYVSVVNRWRDYQNHVSTVFGQKSWFLMLSHRASGWTDYMKVNHPEVQLRYTTTAVVGNILKKLFEEQCGVLEPEDTRVMVETSKTVTVYWKDREKENFPSLDAFSEYLKVNPNRVKLWTSTHN